MDPRFALIGLLIGFLIGLTGMGGGSLMTPIMILVMGVKPVIAVGTDLAYGAITKIVGGASHWQNDTVRRKTAFLMGIGSIPASVLGVGVTSAIKRSHPTLVNQILMKPIAWTLILVAAVLIFKPLLTSLAARRGKKAETNWREGLQGLGDRRPWILPIFGAVIGFLVGLTSVGSGTLIMVGLLFLYPRWQAKDLVGTDVFHASMLVSAAAMAQLWAGNVNVGMTGSLLVGSIPGVLIGSRLVVTFPEKLLRLSLASVLLFSGAKLL